MTLDRLLLGAHTSIAGGYAQAVDRALAAGFTAMQIFVKNNHQWFPRPQPDSSFTSFTHHPRLTELGPIVAHAGYLINPAAPEGQNREHSIRALETELELAEKLSLPLIVIHPGAHVGQGEREGLSQIIRALDTVVAATPKIRCRIALETTAGQGTTIGHSFGHIAEILEKVKKPDRFAVCVDTAHLLAAGYDISNAAGYEKVFSDFDKIIGLKWLALLHLNDSKVPLGSHKDRHEHIGRGHIGLAGFRCIMNDTRFAHIPKILETPKGKEMLEDIENIRKLTGLIKKPKSEPREDKRCKRKGRGAKRENGGRAS